MISFKEQYYQNVFRLFIQELADSGISMSEDINEPFINLLESSLYKALDDTFADLYSKLKKEDDKV